MKVLFLTPQLPYPRISGGLIKSGQLIDYLNQHHQLTIACLLKGPQDQENLGAFKSSMAPVQVHTHPVNIKRSGINFVRSILAGIPLTIFRNHSAQFALSVAQLAQDKDVLFIDHYLMYQYVPEHFKGKVVIHQHNAEFLMWSRKAELEQNTLMRQVLRFEANRIKQYELAMCASNATILATSFDLKVLKDTGAGNENLFETLHCGDEQNLDFPPLKYSETQPQLLFVGTLSWEANVDGLIWFGQQVWPLIKAKMSGVGLTIVGKYSQELENTIKAAIPEATLTGFVDELDALFRSHRVFIAPLRFGSGVKIKVVNSLLRGMPTVTTVIGAEGLDLEHGEHIFIDDQPQGYADSVLTLLRSKDAWKRLSEQSRVWAANNYTSKQESENLRRSLAR